MDITAIIGLIAFLVLIVMGVPIAFSMLFVGLFGLAQIIGFAPALTSAKTIMYHSISNWLYVCVPMFILMGHFANRSGIITEIFNFFNVWFGRLPGALAIVTIATSALFAFATGSSLAATAVLGKITLPEMDRYNYSRKLSLGSIVAGGSLGNLIPPSIGLVLFGIITDQSIGRLLMAAIFPGLIVSILFIIMVIVRVIRNPELVPEASVSKTTWRDKWISFKGVWGVFILIVFVLGSIFAGLATVTEAASVGAFGSFLILILRGKFTWGGLWESLRETARTTAMIFLLIASVSLFTRFLTFSGFTRELGNLIVGSGALPPSLVLIAVYLLFLVSGCLMDATSLMLVLTPIVFPIITKIGFDPIWFGVMTVVMIEIGFMTPPIGLCVYVLKSVSDASLIEIFGSVYPFVAMWLLGVIIMSLFPETTLILPRIMLGG
jgi:tripartite ATP-independent transporter DctM subunit